MRRRKEDHKWAWEPSLLFWCSLLLLLVLLLASSSPEQTNLVLLLANPCLAALFFLHWRCVERSSPLSHCRPRHSFFLVYSPWKKKTTQQCNDRQKEAVLTLLNRSTSRAAIPSRNMYCICMNMWNWRNFWMENFFLQFENFNGCGWCFGRLNIVQVLLWKNFCRSRTGNRWWWQALKRWSSARMQRGEHHLWEEKARRQSEIWRIWQKRSPKNGQILPSQHCLTFTKKNGTIWSGGI